MGNWHRELSQIAMDVQGMAGLTLPDGEFDEWQRLYLFSDPRSLSLGACNQSIRLYRWKGCPLSRGVPLL